MLFRSLPQRVRLRLLAFDDDREPNVSATLAEVFRRARPDGAELNLALDLARNVTNGTGGVQLDGPAGSLTSVAQLYALLPTLRFSDGSTLKPGDIPAKLLNNQISGSNHTKWVTDVSGGWISGGTGADQLYGMGGNDTLEGGAGADTLRGSQGNDLLKGGKGGDTYLYARGDGMDTIVDTDSGWFVTDTLKLADITSRQLWFSRDGNNLDIQVMGSYGADDIRVQDWFLGSANQIERITASDGKSLTAAKVNTLVNAMASMGAPGTDITAANTSASLDKLVTNSWV